MPHERAGRTYFSEFTAPSASLSVGKIQRAKSNEHLSRFIKSKQSRSSLLSPGYFQQELPKAKSTQDLRKDDRKSAKFAASQVYLAAEQPDDSLRLEFEQELEEELQKLLTRSKYNTVTIPSSVKFSVTGDVPNKQPQLAFTSPSHSSSLMSRPRSPKSKEPQRLEGLDQLLHNIRQQLNQLSDERTQMEQRMDDVVNGIQQAQAQYHNRLRNLYQSKKRGLKHSPPTPNSLRRVHSSGEKYTNSVWLIPQTSDTSLDVPDGPSNQKEVVNTFNENSQCSQVEYNTKADSAYSGSCSTRGPRSESFSSIESRSRSSSLNIGGSLSQSNDVFGNWMSNSTILEVPESPRPSAASQPCTSLSQDSFMQSMPSLSYHSYTTPNRHGRPASPLSMSSRQHRSYSTSTPKNHSVRVPSSPKMTRLEPSFKATSSPDVSRKGVPAKPEHHQLKNHTMHSRSHHNSLPDSVMNSVIVEDKVDNQSFTDSLSQLSTCTDDGSPKTAGSTIIVRRSSLTGQLEHIRKPRSVATVKRNSSFDISKDHSSQSSLARPRASSVYGLNNQTLPKEFKVLNRGVRKSRRRKPIILNTSVETTV